MGLARREAIKGLALGCRVGLIKNSVLWKSLELNEKELNELNEKTCQETLMCLKDHIDIDRYLLDWWRRKVL